MSTFYIIKKNNDLLHYGVLGMKWGVRRYQNTDGSLTEKGHKKYDKSRLKADKAIENYKAGKDRYRTKLTDITSVPFWSVSTEQRTKLHDQLDKALKRNDTEYVNKIQKVLNPSATQATIDLNSNMRLTELGARKKKEIIKGSIVAGLAATVAVEALITYKYYM